VLEGRLVNPNAVAYHGRQDRQGSLGVQRSRRWTIKAIAATSGVALTASLPGLQRLAHANSLTTVSYQIAVPNISVTFGTDSTITATVADPNGIPIPSGTIQVKLYGTHWAGFGSSPVWNASVVNGAATFTLPTGSLLVGNSAFYVVAYPVGVNGYATASSTLAGGQITVSPLTMPISVNDESISRGASQVTLVATLPTLPPFFHTWGAVFGTISFRITSGTGQGVASANGVAISDGIAQTTVTLPTGLSAGTYSIEADLRASDKFFTPSSGTGTLTVTVI
jgi:hypothetical protein